MSKIYRCHQSHFKPLEAVGSVSDVMAIWDKSYQAVVYHIIEDHIAAVRTTGGKWLVSLPSAALYFGPPPHPTATHRPLNLSPAALQIKAKSWS